MKIKKENGVTLVALVVTIIVLLILAAITISMVAGNNGILAKAKKAKKAQEEATLIEELSSIIAELQMYEYLPDEGNPELNPDITNIEGVNDNTIIITYKDKDFLTTINDDGTIADISIIEDYDSSDPNNIFAIEDDGTVYLKDREEYYRSPYELSETNIVIPARIDGITVKKLRRHLFAYTNIESVTLPSTLKIIDEGAFEKTKITSIKLPEGLYEIGCWAFCGCDQLKEIIIPKSVKNMGSRYCGDVFGGIASGYPINQSVIIKFRANSENELLIGSGNYGANKNNIIWGYTD